MSLVQLLGKFFKTLRESRGLSQQDLARKANISYQYLSGIENGKENFTIQVFEELCGVIGTSPVDALIQATAASTYPILDIKHLLKDSNLPNLLTATDIFNSLNEAQKIIHLINRTVISATGRPLSAYIQRNNYSGIVSNVLTDAISRLTKYKHNGDQSYPDLICKENSIGLEIKATIQIGKGGESHNGHSGWHLIACFELNEATGDIEFINVMLADLVAYTEKDPNRDWDYVGSKRNEETGSQRTETYNTNIKGKTKLRYGTVYINTEKVNPKSWRFDKNVPVPKSFKRFLEN